MLHSKAGGAWPRATPWELSRSGTKRDRPLPPSSSSSSPPAFSTLVLWFPPPSALCWARPLPSEITPPPRCVCHPAHARERVCGPPTLGADPSPPVLVGGGARCVLVVILPLPASACSLLPARPCVCLLPAAAWCGACCRSLARSPVLALDCPFPPPADLCATPLVAPHRRDSATRVSPRPWCSPPRRPLGAACPPPPPPPRWPSLAHPAWPRRRRRRLWRRRLAPLDCAWRFHRCPPSRRCHRCCTTHARLPPRRPVGAAPPGEAGRP